MSANFRPADVTAALLRLTRLIEGRRDELALLDRDAMIDWLYVHWYSSPAVAFADSFVRPHQPSLLAAIRAALEETVHWQRGWVVLDLEPSQRCLVGRGTLRHVVGLGDFANLSRPGAPAVPGDEVAIFDLLLWIDEPTGFLGVRSQVAEPGGPLVRLYWSVSPTELGHVLRLVVKLMRSVGLPWSLKCPSEAQAFGRVDSVVLYLERRNWPTYEGAVAQLGADVAAHLRDAVPPLTLQLCCGLGFAEDADPLLSFGQTRCRALADGVLKLVRHPTTRTGANALSLLVQALADHGIDPICPWRSPLPSLLNGRDSSPV